LFLIMSNHVNNFCVRYLNIRDSLEGLNTLFNHLFNLHMLHPIVTHGNYFD
jgi:hypothetical protein